MSVYESVGFKIFKYALKFYNVFILVFVNRYTIENNIDGLPSKRRRTALELLQTEATYLKNLTIVIQVKLFAIILVHYYVIS